jgi:GT2 family glycosyltransferase
VRVDLTCSIVIPTHNRPAELDRCLASLRDERVEEIVVVDDGSDPPSRVPEGVVLLRNAVAELPTAARNQGAEHARGEIVLFIDDDCVMAPGCVGALLEAFSTDDRLGIAGPIVAYLESPERIWSAGALRSKWLGRTRFAGRGRTVRSGARLPSDVAGFPSAFAVRRELFRRVDGFDEANFPLHMSEEDLAERVRSHGFRVRLVPDARVFHDMSENGPLARRLHLNPESTFYVARDRGLFIRRHSPNRTALFTRSAFWIGVLAPVYVCGILFDRAWPVRSRIGLASWFIRGLAAGYRLPLEFGSREDR